MESRNVISGNIYQIAAILDCSVYDILPEATLDMEG